MKAKILSLIISVAALMPSTTLAVATTDTNPTDATPTATASEQPQAKPKTVTHNVDKILPGEWVIHSLRGERLQGEERPYIYLDLANKRFYGNNTCNTINGSLTIGTNSTMRFDNLISSRMHCTNAPNEFLINTTLTEVKTYSLKKVGHEYYLELMSGRHVIMELRKHNMQFLNGAWRVSRINGIANNNEGIELVIDVDLCRIHGNTGCNILNGSIFIDPDKRNSLQFIDIITTRAACDSSVPETDLLVALEEVETAISESDNLVILYDNRDRELLQLRRIHPTLSND